MVVIQAIDCVYRKDNRGAPGASERNAFPRALTWTGGTALDEDTLVDRWRIEPPDAPALVSCSPVRPMSGRPFNDELALDWELKDERLRVWFRWNQRVGAPKRATAGSPDLTMRSGEWGQVEFNGRSSPSWGADAWQYLHAVRNVAYFADVTAMPDPSIFLASAPVAHRAHLENLW